MSNNPSAPALVPSRWPLFIIGVLLFAVGPAIYVVQFQMGSLRVPWYVPILALVGIVLMAASVWRTGGIIRTIGLVLFTLICGFEWFALVQSLTRPYTGPAQFGRKLPAFATTLADGKTFSNADLEGGSPAVLLFFRGRW